MRLRSRRRSSRKARIEIVPLIDIMFFLLATFVMVSTAMIKNKGIAVKLPTAESGAAEDRADYAAVSVTDGGELFFNKEKLNREELALRLRALKASTPDPKIFINGDGRASLEAVVAALDEVRRAGITRVAIETRSKT